MIPVPSNGVVLVREESHPMGGCPCSHCPPPGDSTWHFNIEWQKPNSNGKNRAVFNLHIAVWQIGDNVCFASWNNRPSPKCVYSNCVDGTTLEEMQHFVRNIAEEIKEDVGGALQSAYNMLMNLGGIAWEIFQAIGATLLALGEIAVQVIVAIVLAFLWVITYPLHRGGWGFA